MSVNSLGLSPNATRSDSILGQPVTDQTGQEGVKVGSQLVSVAQEVVTQRRSAGRAEPGKTLGGSVKVVSHAGTGTEC